MRWVVLPTTLAVLATWSAPSADAAVPKRDCGSRAENGSPVRRLVSPGDLKIGPVAFFGLRRLADPRELEHFGSRKDGRYLLKTPLKVRAGRVVTVSVAAGDRWLAGLTFAAEAPLGTGVPAVRFAACREDEPAFSYDGVVGPLTVFAGGWSLARPGCVSVSVRVRGRRAPYRREVPFGVRRC